MHRGGRWMDEWMEGINFYQYQLMKVSQNEGMESSGNFLDIGILNPGDITVHLLIHAFQLIGVLLKLHELILEGVEVIHGIGQGIHHIPAGVAHLRDLILQFLHTVHLTHHLLTLLLTLVLQLLPSLHLPLSLHFLLLLLLHLHDAVVHLHQQVRQLGVDLVHQVAEVSRSLVVDVLEEHHRVEILREVLNLPLGEFPLQDLDDLLLLGRLDLLGKVNHLLLDIDESLHIFADLGDTDGVAADDLAADGLDLDVGLVGDLINEVADGQFGALGEDVEDVARFDVTGGTDGPHDGHLALPGHELLVLVLLLGLLEEHDATVVHQVLQKLLLLGFKEIPPLILQVAHLLDFAVVVKNAEVAFRTVDDHDYSLLDILEGLEGLEQVLGEFRQFISPCLADVRFIDHDDDLDLGVDVEQPLHEEGVGDLVFLALVVPEAGTVVEGQIFYDQLVGNGGLGVLLVTDLDGVVRTVQDRLQSVVTHRHLRPREEGHDGGLPHAGVTDDDDGFVTVCVLGDARDTVLDHLAQLQQVQRVLHRLNSGVNQLEIE